MKKIKVLGGQHIYSPKSVVFHPNGKVFYVNALEGMETLVYDSETLELKSIISHKFTDQNKDLFLNGEETLFDYQYNSDTGIGLRNVFGGKPVEATFSHDARYLWVTYYRRSYDENASSPSALAIIDTETNQIVRVMPTGPLAKMIVHSPTHDRIAVIHWGDNTIGLIDISSDDPMKFHYTNLLTCGHKLSLKGIRGNRDNHCGFCLRGAAFSADGKYLFVGRMGGGGIAVFRVTDGVLLGSQMAVAPTPRHLTISHDGQTLYVASTSSSIISALNVDQLIQSVEKANGSRVSSYGGKKLFIGGKPRTLVLSPNGKRLYAACNQSRELVRIDIDSWKVTGRIASPAYPVGLAVSPDERLLVSTSQGHHGHGGNALGVFSSGIE